MGRSEMISRSDRIECLLWVLVFTWVTDYGVWLTLGVVVAVAVLSVVLSAAWDGLKG